MVTIRRPIAAYPIHGLFFYWQTRAIMTEGEHNRDSKDRVLAASA